jgi:hypothetical protein
MAFLRAGLVDRLYLFDAPLLLGADGRPATLSLGVEANTWRMNRVLRRIGERFENANSLIGNDSRVRDCILDEREEFKLGNSEHLPKCEQDHEFSQAGTEWAK